MKLLGAVRYNDNIALIVDDIKPLIYEHVCYSTGHTGIADDLLFGENDDGVVDTLIYHKYDFGPKAFGGAKISWPLKNGSVLETDGWWWSGGYSHIEKMRQRAIVYVPMATMATLAHYYVYTTQAMFADRYHALLSDYVERRGKSLPVYGYHSFGDAITETKLQYQLPVDPQEAWDLVEHTLQKRSEVLP